MTGMLVLVMFQTQTWPRARWRDRRWRNRWICRVLRQVALQENEGENRLVTQAFVKNGKRSILCTQLAVARQ